MTLGWVSRAQDVADIRNGAKTVSNGATQTTEISSTDNLEMNILDAPASNIVILRDEAAAQAVYSLGRDPLPVKYCVIGYPGERECDGQALGRSWVISQTIKASVNHA